MNAAANNTKTTRHIKLFSKMGDAQDFAVSLAFLGEYPSKSFDHVARMWSVEW